MRKITSLSFLFFIFFLLVLPNASSQLLSDKVYLMDSSGYITGSSGNYLVSKDGFMVVNNEGIIKISYTVGNETILERKTIKPLLILDTYDGARLKIENNTGVVLFSGSIYEFNAYNLFNHGIGRYFNNNIIMAIPAFCFAIVINALHLMYFMKKVY